MQIVGEKNKKRKKEADTSMQFPFNKSMMYECLSPEPIAWS